MDALRLLCLLAMSFYAVEQIAGQTQKMPGEWSVQLADKYPKPLENDAKCKVESRPMKICDPNDVLDINTRNEANEILQKLENLTIHHIANCHQPGVFVVALLRSIVNDAHDKGDETVKIAEKFQQIWPLNNCSAVFVISGNDNTCGLILGDALKQLLPGLNNISSINSSSSICFTGNRFQSNITTLTSCLSDALAKEIKNIPTPPTEGTPTVSSGSTSKSLPSPDSAHKNRSSFANHPLIGNILFILVTLSLLLL